MPPNIERPEERELEELFSRFSEVDVKEEKVELKNLLYQRDYRDCKGEAVIKIKKGEEIIGVRHRGGERFVLPMGRVWESEEFVEGGKREAKEETGLDVSITDLLEIKKVTFEFSNDSLERWHFLFEGERLDGEMGADDEDEIEEVQAFPDRYYWEDGFYIIDERG